MLSFHHEILVELFRGDGKLAFEQLRTRAGISVDHAAGRGWLDLSQVTPTEYRADAVDVRAAAMIRKHDGPRRMERR